MVGRGGSSPSFSRDGTALVWTDGGRRDAASRGRTVHVADNASDPAVSDYTSGCWGVVFQTSSRLQSNDTNPGTDVYMRRSAAAAAWPAPT